MAAQQQYEELARQLSAIGAVKRGLARVLPPECPPGAAVALLVLDRYGEMRMSKLAELLGVDMSVTSRHVAHVESHGWIDRLPDPQDKRSRLLRLNGSGAAMLAQISEHYAAALANRLRDWSDEDVSRLAELLARLRTDFGDARSRACRPVTADAAPAPAPALAPAPASIPAHPQHA